MTETKTNPVPDDVRWSPDGFGLDVSAWDSLYVNRMAVVGAVVGILLAGPVAMLGYPGRVFDLWLVSVAGLGFVGSVVGWIVGAARSRRRTQVAFDAHGLHVGQGSQRRTAPWAEVTGVRIRGPHPWVVHVELPSGALDVPVGEEVNARWLADHVAQRARNLGEHGGDDTDVPEAIRHLAARDAAGSAAE